MKNLLRLLALTLIVVVPAFAQDAQEAKTKAYTDFYNAVSAQKQDEAYRIGKDYVSKYGNETDEGTKYVKTFVESYESGQRLGRIAKVISSASIGEPSKANFNEAYTLGRQILQSEPENLNVLIALGYSGYTANAQNNTAFNQEAVGYARKAISFLESGREPEDLYPAREDIGPFFPFSNRDETLAYLNYGLGELALKSNPSEAARYYVKATTFNSPVKTAPLTYLKLAGAYAASEYEPKSKEIAEKYPAGSPETEESKAAIAELNQIIDRLMDAHARVIAYSTTPESKSMKDTSTQIVTQLYKFRNNDSTEGLQTYLAGITSKPLPQPGVNTPATPAATTTTGSATTPATSQPTSNTPPSSATMSTTAPRSNATTITPAATTKPATTPMAAKPVTTTTKQTGNARRP